MASAKGVKRYPNRKAPVQFTNAIGDCLPQPLAAAVANGCWVGGELIFWHYLNIQRRRAHRLSAFPEKVLVMGPDKDYLDSVVAAMNASGCPWEFMEVETFHVTQPDLMIQMAHELADNLYSVYGIYVHAGGVYMTSQSYCDINRKRYRCDDQDNPRKRFFDAINFVQYLPTKRRRNGGRPAKRPCLGKSPQEIVTNGVGAILDQAAEGLTDDMRKAMNDLLSTVTFK